jgi:hypothetical protein
MRRSHEHRDHCTRIDEADRSCVIINDLSKAAAQTHTQIPWHTSATPIGSRLLSNANNGEGMTQSLPLNGFSNATIQVNGAFNIPVPIPQAMPDKNDAVISLTEGSVVYPLAISFVESAGTIQVIGNGPTNVRVVMVP